MMRSTTLLAALLVGVLAAASVPAAAQMRAGGGIARHAAADPSAPAVTADTLPLEDRFWPFRVRMTSAWVPPGGTEPVPLDRPGVLVRVNDDGTARVDFASRGRFEVPIDRTDLVERANRVRTGEIEKFGPNLVVTIGNKLIDTSGDDVRVYTIFLDTPVRGILCVYADPAADDFAVLAEQLGPLAARHDLEVVVLPQTESKDLAVWRRFREVGLEAPFVRFRYMAPFTRSLLGPAPSPLPYFQLATREGRVLRAGPWDADAPAGVLALVSGKAPGAASGER